jgi:hypothetical protein
MSSLSFSENIFDLLFSVDCDNRTQSLHKCIQDYISQPLELNITSKYPNGEDGVLQINPIPLFYLRKMINFIAKQCGGSAGDVNEILNGNQMPFVRLGIEEFICHASSNNASVLIYYNGEPMDINDVCKNIFSRSLVGDDIMLESEYQNQTYIYAEIIEYFTWSYCFFLHSRYTVIGAIQEFNLMLQQITLKSSQMKEMQWLMQKEEVINQIQQSMTEQSKEQQKSKKNSKKKQSTKPHVN